MKLCRLKNRIIIFSLIIICILFHMSFADKLNRIICPYCGKNEVEILDEEYGICHCSNCDGYLIISNGKVKLENGSTMSIKDLYDVDALIEEIENNISDDDEDDRNNYREYLEDEDDEGEESYFEEIDDDIENKKNSNGSSSSSSSSNESNDGDEEIITSNKKKYKSDAEILLMLKKEFSNYEPESEDEILDMIAKYKGDDKESKKQNSLQDVNIPIVSTISEVKKKSPEEEIKIYTITHVIRYNNDDANEEINKDIIFNGIEYTLKFPNPRNGYKFLYWELKDSKKIHIHAGEKVVFYNFNKKSQLTARIYDFNAVWEKIDEK